LGCFGFRCWKKREANAEDFGEFDSLFRRSRAKKRFWQGGQQPCAVSAGAIRINTAAMRETLEGGQSKLDNVVAGSSAKAGDETGAAGIVVGMAPVGVPIRAGTGF
jgi:hypothetical protein